MLEKCTSAAGSASENTPAAGANYTASNQKQAAAGVLYIKMCTLDISVQWKLAAPSGAELISFNCCVGCGLA